MITHNKLAVLLLISGLAFILAKDKMFTVDVK